MKKTETFGQAMGYRILPFAPIWVALALLYSEWFILALPVGVGLAWLQTRGSRLL